MKGYYFILLPFFLLLRPASAQQQRIDSLVIMLQTSKADTQQVLILNELAHLFSISQPDSTLKYTQQGLTLARSLAFTKGEVLLLNRLAEYQERQGNYVKGVEHATLALQLAEKINLTHSAADAAFMLAIIYTDGLKQYDTALKYADKALDSYQLIGNQDGIANVLNLKAWVYAMTYQDFKIAQQYVVRAIQISKNTPSATYLGYYLGTKGLICEKENKFDSAIIYLQQANLLLEKLQDKAIIAYYNIILGNIYFKQGKYVEAKALYEQALKDSKQVNAREFLKEAYKGLAEVYAQQQSYEQAYSYQRAYLSLNDSVMNKEVSQKIATLQLGYEDEKQKTKIAFLEKEKILAQEEKRVYAIVFVSIVVFIFSILLLSVMNSRQRVKANLLLQEKNEEIATQNEELRQSKEEIAAQNEELRQSREEVVLQRNLLEKVVAERTQELNLTVENLLKHNQDLEQFSYIVSHNMRAPVARIQGLVNIFNKDNMSDEFNKEILKHLYDSSQSLDTILKDLTQIISIRKSIYIQKEYINIKEIIDIELVNLGNEINQTQAMIEKEIQIEEFYSIRAYMQSIIHNLISNAIKYRYPSRQLKILIRTYREGDTFYFTIQDNGLGVSLADPYKIFGLYQRMHTHVEGKGLGLYLVKTQIEAMNGTIQVESKINEGTTFKVALPLFSSL